MWSGVRKSVRKMYFLVCLINPNIFNTCANRKIDRLLEKSGYGHAVERAYTHKIWLGTSLSA
jgi:hypothetical protein